MAGKIQVGDTLPPFILNDQHGQAFDLGEHFGKFILVLFFYPWDFTRVCTKEACGFRDYQSEFEAAGAQIIGVSFNDTASHASFAQTHQLNYPLLTDKGGRIRRKFGFGMLGGLVPGRYTLIVDLEGRVRHLSKDLFQAESHIEGALQAVRNLQQEYNNLKP